MLIAARPPNDPWSGDAGLPAVEVQHAVEGFAGRRPERLAREVRRGQQHAVAHVRRDPDELRDLALVAQVQGGPGAAEAAGAGGDLVAPRGREQRPPEPGLVSAGSSAAASMQARTSTGTSPMCSAR